MLLTKLNNEKMLSLLCLSRWKLIDSASSIKCACKKVPLKDGPFLKAGENRIIIVIFNVSGTG